MKRIYVVICSEREEEILVKAASASQAIRTVVHPLYKAEVATQDDLIRLAKTHTVKEA